MLKTQLNESARERETLRADKEQERERRKNTEKELRQVKAKDKLLTKGVIEYLVLHTCTFVDILRLSRDRLPVLVVKIKWRKMN